MLYLAADLPDISKVPADFTQYYIILTGFFVMIAIQVINTAFNVWNARQSKKTEISGAIESTQPVQHAEKAELTALQQSVNAMREENAAMHRNAQTEGQNRVMAITQDVNAEMGSVLFKIGELSKMITTALIDNGTQGEAINNIKAELNKKDASIIALHRRIDDLIQAGRNKRTPS